MPASQRKGFIVIEASLTTFLIATAMVALITVFFVTLRANERSEETVVASNLSLKLMEEIRLRRWDEKSPVPSGYVTNPSLIGLDTGETAGDKRTFDDIDDFNAWSEPKPLDPVMGALPDFAAYSSSVAVRYVDPSTLAPSGQRTDFKQVSVCTWRAGRRSICLDTILTNR